MEYEAGRIGRIFWVRLDHGDDLKAGLLDLAGREKVGRALVLALGALEKAEAVCGPRKPVLPPDPLWEKFSDGREILGMGTIMPGPKGPEIHFHFGAGRTGEPTLAGCLRGESKVYLVAEAVVLEVEGLTARRAPDPVSGFNLPSFGEE